MVTQTGWNSARNVEGSGFSVEDGALESSKSTICFVKKVASAKCEAKLTVNFNQHARRTLVLVTLRGSLVILYSVHILWMPSVPLFLRDCRRKK